MAEFLFLKYWIILRIQHFSEISTRGELKSEEETNTIREEYEEKIRMKEKTFRETIQKREQVYMDIIMIDKKQWVDLCDSYL